MKSISLPKFLIFVGIVYALIVRYTSFCIPCFFQTVTGFRCPSCGITHIFLHLMDFDFAGAFYANRFLFATSPLLLLIVILNLFCGNKIRKKPFTKWLTILYLISLIVWAVIRNIMHI
ncbi:MAG: DUF2752 domain-containing protein [Roseburia sp.]|nr:DUF2752 domain-containing protein [Roseburia sp.]